MHAGGALADNLGVWMHVRMHTCYVCACERVCACVSMCAVSVVYAHVFPPHPSACSCGVFPAHHTQSGILQHIAYCMWVYPSPPLPPFLIPPSSSHLTHPTLLIPPYSRTVYL